MARSSLLALYISLAASGAASALGVAKSPALIPFADFDAGEHSYSLAFIIDHDPTNGYSKFYKKMHTAPLKIYDSILSRCDRLGNITPTASRNTNQMLVATKWQNWGVDFIYTDSIDYNDPMQACIQNIGNPSMQRNFATAAAAKVESDPENEVAQSVKEEATKKSKGSVIQVGLCPVVWAFLCAFFGWIIFT